MVALAAAFVTAAAVTAVATTAVLPIVVATAAEWIVAGEFVVV